MHKLSHATDKHPGFQIVGDNVDVHVNVRHETMAKKAKDMHWFQIYAVKNRVSGEHLPNSTHIRSVLSVPNSVFIPTVEDCLLLRSHLIIICSRILLKYCSFFEKFRDCIEMHIQHDYSSQMSKPSEIVSCLVLLLLYNTTN